jgi:hypothetical protein
MERKAYPSDVSDDEWALVTPYLTLMMADASQRVRGLSWPVLACPGGRRVTSDAP